jgi:transposase
MSVHREILRHIFVLGLSCNKVHEALGVSRGKVQDCVSRAHSASLCWELIESLPDDQLERMLFPEKQIHDEQQYQPDWEKVLAELQRRGVKLRLLYEERREAGTINISYSQFCRQFRKWAQSRELSMRQEHKAAEKLYVDFAGMTLRVTDPVTGETEPAQIFVATFGASNYTYFEGIPSQKLQPWISAHINAFKHFGGLPKFVVPDNLKSAIVSADKFDPILNRTYQRFAEHYELGILPARKQRPKDKAKVEKGVQNTEYRALAKLRDRTFFSYEELNRELVILMNETNNEPFQKLSGSRASWFADVDQPALRPCPKEDFEFEEWVVGVRVPKDYHINLFNHFYSVPYKLVEQIVDVRFTQYAVEIIHNNGRAASHVRSWAEGEKTTAPEHLAPTHALYHGLTPEYFLKQSALIGPSANTVVKALLDSKIYPQLSYGECFGIVKTLKSNFGAEDVELACMQAIRLQSIGYRVIKGILKAGVRNLPQQITLRLGDIQHENLRGSKHYK